MDVVALWGNISLKYGFYTISFSFFMDVNIYNIVNSVLGVEIVVLKIEWGIYAVCNKTCEGLFRWGNWWIFTLTLPITLFTFRRQETVHDYSEEYCFYKWF